MGDHSLVLVGKDSHLTIITINRPDVMNALPAPATAAFPDVLDEFVNDPDQSAGIGVCRDYVQV